MLPDDVHLLDDTFATVFNAVVVDTGRKVGEVHADVTVASLSRPDFVTK